MARLPCGCSLSATMREVQRGLRARAGPLAWSECSCPLLLPVLPGCGRARGAGPARSALRPLRRGPAHGAHPDPRHPPTSALRALRSGAVHQVSRGPAAAGRLALLLGPLPRRRPPRTPLGGGVKCLWFLGALFAALLVCDRLHNLVLWRRVEGSRIQAWGKYGREPGSRRLGLPLVLLGLCLWRWWAG